MSVTISFMPSYNDNHKAAKENFGEIENIKKISQKNVRIVYNS